VTLTIPTIGRLSETRLPTLLRALQHAQATGALTITRNDQTKVIYFKAGDIVFASSRYEDERLGELLLKWGKITFAQYETSVRLLTETKKQQGTIMVEEGFLTPKELFQAVIGQVKEIIFSLFTWLDGDYEFVMQALPSEEVIPLRMSSGALIYEGIRRIHDFSRLCRLLPPLDTVVTMSTKPRDLFQTVAIRRDEQQLLLLIDGVKTIRELVYAATLPSLRAFQMIYFLLAAGIIQVNTEEEPGERTVVFRSNVQSELKAIIPEAIGRKKQEELDLSGGELFELREDEKLASSPDAIRRAYETLKGKDHYEVLGVSRKDSPIVIKKAYFRLAKAYHPDRHYEPGMETLNEALEVLFDRLTEAYGVLSRPQSRRQYDESQEQQHHVPAKVEAEPGPLQQSVQQPAQPSVQQPVIQAAGQPAGQAAEQCKRGEAALLAGNIKDAVKCLESAVRQDGSNAHYHALLGQAMTSLPERRKEAEAELKRAIELDLSNADYYVILGLLYLKRKSMGKALAQFEEALRCDPHNARAKEQVEKLTKGVFD
jgi:curved DNA-binding protein CbpA